MQVDSLVTLTQLRRSKEEREGVELGRCRQALSAAQRQLEAARKSLQSLQNEVSQREPPSAKPLGVHDLLGRERHLQLLRARVLNARSCLDQAKQTVDRAERALRAQILRLAAARSASEHADEALAQARRQENLSRQQAQDRELEDIHASRHAATRGRPSTPRRNS